MSVATATRAVTVALFQGTLPCSVCQEDTTQTLWNVLPCVNGNYDLLYKRTLLNVPSDIVHTVSSYLRCRTFEKSFQMSTSTRQGMEAELAEGGSIAQDLFSLYVKDMPSQSQHFELALYADDTAIIATSRKKTLLAVYLESYRNDRR